MKFHLSTTFSLFALVAALHAAGLPDDLKTGGFAIGCQAWTFNHFTVTEAIDKTAASGAKVIEFFPGQKLSPEQPGIAFSHDAPKEAWDVVKKRLAEKKITPVAYGVVGLSKDEAASRKVFEFAKYFGIRVINTESVDAIDTFEKLVKEYDIKVGFHDHPKHDDDPNYKMWDPTYILSIVKDRDPRIGSCADTGHWVRSGIKPVDAIRILKGRIMSSHLKDLNEFSRDGHDVPFGEGKSDVVGILNEYKAQGFDGPISVEYEYKMEDNLAEVTKCIAFVRDFGAKKKE
jgi:sugar phosphate isomerase/epimerase